MSSQGTSSNKRRLVRRRPPRSPDGTMTLIEHLRELRNRIVKAVILVVVGAIAAYFFYDPILHVLKEPYCSLPPDKRAFNGPHDTCRLLFTGPLEGFFMRLKISVIAGIVLSSPFWLYQIWAFITPGLKKKERKLTLTFVFCSTALFLLGAVLSYYVVKHGLTFLLSAAGSGTVAALAIKPYISFLIAMLLIFGVGFEVPLLVVMLNLVGVLPYSVLKKFQRLIVFLIFCFAGVATPSGDPFTMLALAIPMVVLFEVSAVIAWRHDKRKAAQESKDFFHNLSDDEASPLDTTPSEVEEPSSVDESPH